MGRVQTLAAKRFITSVFIILTLTQLLALVGEARAQGGAGEIQATAQKTEGAKAALGQNHDSSTSAKLASAPTERKQ